MNEPDAKDATRRNETLQELLRGEISAVETYRQAIDRSGEHPRAQDLLRLLHEHQQAVQQLRRQLETDGEEPSGDSGAWGIWARAVQAAANVLGDAAALGALKKGEQHGVDEYEQALAEGELDTESATLIRNSLLPRQRTHLAMLNRLILEQ